MAERVFEEFFRTYHPVMVAAAFNRLSDVGDAEDAAAEVFALAWRRRDDTDNVLTIGWLYSTLRNVVGNQYRARARHARRVEQARMNHDDTDRTVSDASLDVRAAVNRLAEADRELIWMAYWEDLTREEMAEILGCSPGAVRVRLHRARERLTHALAADGNEQGREFRLGKEDAWTISN